MADAGCTLIDETKSTVGKAIARKTGLGFVDLDEVIASEGMRQSPRGERLAEPTLGPSGTQDRLNCWEKKRVTNTRSQRRIVAVGNPPLDRRG